MRKEVTVPKASWGTAVAGVALGAATAVAFALAGGVVYGEGDSLTPLLAIVGAAGSLALVYDESPKRWVLALYAALIVSSFLVLSSHLRGGVDGAMVLAVAVVAEALTIGFSLVLSDM